MPPELTPPYTISAQTATAGRRSAGLRGRRVALEGLALVASTALVALLPASIQGGGPWSLPALLASCSAAGSPSVLFPKDSPGHATGAGAIVWGSASSCPGGAGARVAPVAIGADLPGRPAPARTRTGHALALAAPIAATSAAHGRILLAARSATPGQGLLVGEGLAEGPFALVQSTGGAASPLALATAYLGDLALVSPAGGEGAQSGGSSPLELRVHRRFQPAFLPPVVVSSAASGSIEGLTLALDYRSDAFVAWEQDGFIDARYMDTRDPSGAAVQRVAAVAPHAHIAALLSDDNRAILAWAETRGGVTSVYAEVSAVGVHFGAPRLVERFVDPEHAPPPSGSPSLVRLASESVVLAWSGAEAGHWVVRGAPMDIHGVRSVTTISNPRRESLLLDLTAGPANEVLALWSEPSEQPAGSAAAGGQALYAARGVDVHPGSTAFTAPELITMPGAAGTDGEAAVGVDPDSGRAVAAWRTPAGAIGYSQRSADAG
jgi:hypothetical protein